MRRGTIEALYEQVRSAMPSAAAFAPATLQVVSPGIRVLALRTPTLPPAAHTNVYLVGPDVGPVAVVDPGSPYPEQQAVLDAVLEQLPISTVLLTHHHGDHVGGAAALAARWGVPIAAHVATARRLEGVLEVTRPIADGEVVHGATAVFTPGHADGHLCFEVGGAMIAGDMVAGIGTILIDPDEGDMSQYLASLERLRARSARLLLPAHGPPIADGPAKLTEYLAHRRMREDRVLAALTETPRTVAEMLPTTYSDTPRVLWPLAERSLRAHLVKLVREGRVRDDGGSRFSRS
ncbi:MAG TPA: MBL fold metallo-hydrolase [Kofleriaceae bacterium]|nr:MBL fold metallo-hydrolase [Kofleriaceae bacterium]